jgi:hypothetical protein
MSHRNQIAVAGLLALAFLSQRIAGAQTVEIERDEGRWQVEVVEIVPLSLGDRELVGELADALSLFGGKVENAEIRSAVAKSNAKTASMTPGELTALSERWTKSTNSAEMVTAVLTAPCSEVLRKFRETFQDFGLMLVTDRAGVVVCETERTDRFSFGGEPWLKTVLNPTGADGAMGAPIRPKAEGAEPRTPILVPVSDPDTGERIGVGLALVDAVVR